MLFNAYKSTKSENCLSKTYSSKIDAEFNALGCDVKWLG